MQIIKTCLIAFFVSFSSLTFPTEVNVSIDTGTGILEGTLQQTRESNKVALIIAGSGPTDRNGNNPAMGNNSLKMLSEGLYKAGISSLRFDKRGVGASLGAATAAHQLRFDHYVDDAKRWIKYLEKDTAFNEIIVIGHSEGALVGMLAFQMTEADKFISLAGAGEAIDQIIHKQLLAQSAILAEESAGIMEELRQGRLVKSIPTKLLPLFHPNIQPYMISWLKYSPQKEIAKLNKPILIVQGTTDIQIGLEQAEALKSANPKAQLALIEGMNHVLKKAPTSRVDNFKTYSDPHLPIEPKLIKTIREFIEL